MCVSKMCKSFDIWHISINSCTSTVYNIIWIWHVSYIIDAYICILHLYWHSSKPDASTPKLPSSPPHDHGATPNARPCSPCPAWHWSMLWPPLTAARCPKIHPLQPYAMQTWFHRWCWDLEATAAVLPPFPKMKCRRRKRMHSSSKHIIHF